MLKTTHIQDLSQYSDQQLWRGIQLNDHEQFAELYRRYVVVLSNQAYRVLQDEEMVKDIVQEVFLNLYLKRHELAEDTNPGAYLNVSIKNRSLNRLRDIRLRTRHLTSIQANDGQTSSLDRIIEDRIGIQERLQQMPAKLQTAFFMRHRDQKTNQEIGEVLGVSPRTVERYLTSASQHISNKQEQ